MLLNLQALRFVFQAREGIYFPEDKSANILRGAFGTIFRQLACVPECQSAATCDLRTSCPYAQMFEPTGQAPSGLTDWPRPFVFRASHLDGKSYLPGEQFHFDLNLFDLRGPAKQYLALTFAQLAREGLGPGRKRVELLRVEEEMIHVPLASSKQATWATIRFLTPTELKDKSRVAAKPEFKILLTRIRDRISALCQLYGDGAPAIHYKALGERAGLVEMVNCDVRQVTANRKSTRTGQTHSIGGFIGEATYRGPLTEFLPWLEAATWTGVGRQTVWGKGQIQTISGVFEGS